MFSQNKVKVSNKFIFKNIEYSSEKLYKFNIFCRNNKYLINKIINETFTKNENEVDND